MVMPQPFTTASPILASYDYTDFIDGSGVVNFLGGNSQNTTTLNYFMTRESTRSNNSSTSSTELFSAVADTKKLDIDFDILINIPRTIKGTIFVTVPVAVTSRNSGSTSMRVIGKLRKVRDGVESEVSSGTSATYGVSNTPAGSSVTFKIDVTTEEHYATGDILRLTCEVWASQNTGSSQVTIYHDPANRTTGMLATNPSSQLNIRIPFLIEQ